MSQVKEITATPVRSKETMQRYITTLNNRRKSDAGNNPFDMALSNENIRIKSFEHWFIIENEFPYDAIASTNHMICTKRKVAFDWSLLSNEEKNEFQLLRESYLNEYYDVIYENLPSGQTQPGHFHVHLLKLKRTSLDEFMRS